MSKKPLIQDPPFEQKLDRVYLAEYTSCIYESGYSVLSAHRTESGAHAALDKHRDKLKKQSGKSWNMIARLSDWRVRPLKVRE